MQNDNIPQSFSVGNPDAHIEYLPIQSVRCHTFRATGITCYLLGGGSLEQAQHIACHESACTTKLYDRTSDTISLDEIERIIIGRDFAGQTIPPFPMQFLNA